MLVFKNAEICVTPNANPNACRWNIGGVGSLMRGAGVGHVYFMFFVLISFALGSQREASFQWNMGFTVFPTSFLSFFFFFLLQFPDYQYINSTGRSSSPFSILPVTYDVEIKSSLPV